MAEIATASPYIYLATFFFALSAVSSDLLFIRISLMGGFLFLVLASLSGHSPSGSFVTIPIADGIIDITMFVNMILFCVNMTIVLRLINDEQPHGKLSPDEEALFRFFQARSGMTPLQFQHVLKNGEFVDLPAYTVVPKCASNLYLVMEGLVSCKAKFSGDHVSHTFIKRSGEFFDIKLFNLFSLPVGFDNLEFQARTLTATKFFRWNVHGLVAMREAQSPSLKQYWEYIVLTAMTGAAIRNHLKRDDTLYDSLMIPERKAWLDGARSRDFAKETATKAGTWGHWKQQFAMIGSSMLQIIPPRGVRQHPCLPYGINPKQAYLELLCKTDEAEYAADEQLQEQHNPTTTITSNNKSNRKSDIEMGKLGLLVAIMTLSMVVDPVVALAASNNQNSKLLILGLGRVGLEVAKVALDASKTHVPFTKVTGTVRDISTAQSTEDGVQRIPFDSSVVKEELMGSEKLDGATHVLFTIPLQGQPNSTMDQVWTHVRDWWDTNPEGKLGILSTTGVYGDHNGGLVTEYSELLCEAESNAYLYRQLEEEWIDRAKMASMDNTRLFIFRCAGIYDTSRSALHTVYKNGFDVQTNVESPKTKIAPKTNRIHSTDIARAVVHAFLNRETTESFRIYNLADDEPVSRQVVLSHAKELLLSIGCNIPTPTTTEVPSRSATARQSRRAREQKLVSNQRMKEELLPNGLSFPTYREGLQSILEDPTSPWQQEP